MTISWSKAGIAEGQFRSKGIKPLHLSLRTRDKDEADERHAAVQKLFRQRRVEMIDQLRSGALTVERVTAMVEHHEPLVPVAPAPIVVEAALEKEEPWDTVDANADRYLDWIEAHPNREKATLANAHFQLKRFRDFVVDGVRIGGMELDDVTSAMIQTYQKSQVTGKVPPNTITTYMVRVSALFRWAQAQEERSARERHDVPRILYSPVDPEMLFREVHRRDRVLSAEEANAVIVATPEPILFPVACGLVAGLRIGETLHLRPGLDVDLEVGTITIRKQPDWKPKTKRSHRLVPMTESLRALAERHVAKYANASWMCPSPVDPSRPITELGFRPHFKQVVERAQLIYGRENPQGVVYHTLRHSFASHAVMRGVDLYTVAKLLGDSLKTVEDVYADLSPDHKRAAVAKLAGAFSLPSIGAGE